MNTRHLFVTALAALLLSGCGQSDSSNSSSAAAPSGPRIVEITAGTNDAMKYDLTTIEAKPGESLTVVLTNNGTVPKEVMGHDWILLKADADPAAFATAAAAAKATDYVPPALKDEILAQIALLGPRKSDEVTFNAPAVPGQYPYLCTFPGHYQGGMHGFLVVK